MSSKYSNMNGLYIKNINVLRCVSPLSFLLVVLLLFSVSCKKYVTPKKTERIIQKDSWSINRFVLNDSIITDQFADMPMTFESDGAVFVKGIVGTSGNWSTGINKKPTILFLNSFNGDNLFALNNDWEVLSVSNKRIELQSDGNSVTLVKFE